MVDESTFCTVAGGSMWDRLKINDRGHVPCEDATCPMAVWLTSTVSGQRWSSMAQRMKLYQALTVRRTSVGGRNCWVCSYDVKS